MRVELDFRSHVPIYLQIVERIKSLVATGSLQPGDQLPTVRQLAADLRVNFNTVARAYRILDQAGLISTQQGRGTYVLEALPPGQAERLRRLTLRGLVRSFLMDTARLGFSPAEVGREIEAGLVHWRADGAPPEDGNEET
ncbi:MAG: GntR family transcriptional regulator [Chloroflexota bacterium]